jgi:hypothetical protein
MAVRRGAEGLARAAGSAEACLASANPAKRSFSSLPSAIAQATTTHAGNPTALQRAAAAFTSNAHLLSRGGSGFKNFRPRKSHTERQPKEAKEEGSGGTGGNGNNNNNNNNNGGNNMNETTRQLIGTGMLTGAFIQRSLS